MSEAKNFVPLGNRLALQELVTEIQCVLNSTLLAYQRAGGMYSFSVSLIVFGILLAVLFINGICELCLRGLQLSWAIGGQRQRNLTGHIKNSVKTQNFISVHIATHNEPAELVIATLNSLARSRYTEYEVILLDNNTADPAVWQPVAVAAAALGPRFRFIHLDRVKGAKAGALNEALRRVDPRTTHVAVVDADYQVTPDFLRDSVAALIGSGVDYVQFPQAYRGVSPHAIGVQRELGDYFASFALEAGRAGAMLPTGTLSLFDVAALRAIGGWSSCSITEDAEIGVRLQASGYRGAWVGGERGHGLLPLDFAGLRTQRARWAAGNFQVLRRVFSGRPLSWSRAELLKLIVQLTAWLSLWCLPAIALMLGALPHVPFDALISGIAAATICGSAALTAARMAAMGRTGHADSTAYISALATKLALTWTSATAWFPALLGYSMVFHRTRKDMADGAGQAEITLAIVSLAYTMLTLIYAVRLQPLQMLACALLASVWPCAALVDRNLKASARLNPEIA